MFVPLNNVVPLREAFYCAVNVAGTALWKKSADVVL